MKVKIKYHYTREVNRDMSVKECTMELISWDFDFLEKLCANLDDAGYTVMSVSIDDEGEMLKMGEYVE